MMMAVWLGIAGMACAAGFLWWKPPFLVVALAMDGCHYRFVAKRARRFVDAPRARQASLMTALSLLALRRNDQARSFLETLPLERQPEAPTMAYLMAIVRVAEGRDDEAVTLLIQCLAGAPEYRREIIANPTFEHLLFGSGKQVIGPSKTRCDRQADMLAPALIGPKQGRSARWRPPSKPRAREGRRGSSNQGS